VCARVRYGHAPYRGGCVGGWVHQSTCVCVRTHITTTCFVVATAVGVVYATVVAASFLVGVEIATAATTVTATVSLAAGLAHATTAPVATTSTAVVACVAGSVASAVHTVPLAR
jgi:hypothetical protein